MSSKHKVSLHYPSEGCQIYLTLHSGMLPTFHYFKNGKIVDAASIDIPNGFIQQGKEVDCYGNKPVFHSYSDGSIDLTVPITGGRTIIVEHNNKYQVRLLFGRSPIIRAYYYGVGEIPQPGGITYHVVENSANKYRLLIKNSDGDVMTDYTCSKLSFRMNSDFTYYAQYRETWVYSAAAHHHLGPHTVTNVTEENYGTMVLLWDYSGKPAVDISSFILQATTVPAGSSFEQIIPDSITDDIFSKFAVPDVNNCENLMQLKEYRKAIPPIMKLLKKKNFKSLAEFYLWYKYSFKTSCMDIEAYYKFLSQWLTESKSKNDCKHISLTYSATPHFKEGLASQITRYNIYTNTYNGGVLDKLGLSINLSNTWDIIPFSFIADWFINIGDILNRIDENDTLAEVKIFAIVTSNKSIVTYHPFASLGIGDCITHVTYKRDNGMQLPVGKLSVSLLNPSRHIVDGAALIFANKH